jgi:hypothetical protein
MVPERSFYLRYCFKGYGSIAGRRFGFSLPLAKRGVPCQAIAMGNKDARGREKKKPKKVKAERIVMAPPAPRIVTTPAPPRIVGDATEKKP